ncbi:hypothetical protein B0H14DRAFT_3486605 [Mycena olivaceomarginata]|nr:hypothetical protein B0H14DRAFT_3486605 [Mycena olivaceomarginata]
MATARDTVISTPELLEQTLSHLPMRDLLAVAPLALRWVYSAAFKAMPRATAPAAFQRADASWRRMLVIQPPTQTLLVTQRSQGQAGTSERRGLLEDLYELRMGVLYDLVVPFVDSGASFGFALAQWPRCHHIAIVRMYP